MTETNEPYLFEHDRKVTPTNVNLLNSTENDWILQKIENIIIFGHIQLFMFVIVAILIKFFCYIQQVNVRRCHFSVMFKDFGHI